MASKNIKGITVQIGADVTSLDKGLKQADKSIKEVRNELAEVEKALKLDPGNTTLLAQKQELLAEQVNKTKDKLKLLRDAQGQVVEQFKSGQISGEQYRAFQREVTNTESALRRLRNESTTYNREQSSLHRTTESLRENLKNLAKAFEGVAEHAKKIAGSTLTAVQTSFKAVTKEVELGIKAFEAYVAGLTTATTAIGGFAISSGASFEQSMSKVQSLSGATGDDLKALEDAAREMGASTSKSASEAADALSYMALAGWDNTQMLTGLEPILRASEAGEMDLATCSDLVTDSMSAMGIQTEELAGYLDVVTNTQNSANTSMQQMLEAYVGCGGTLKNLEVPLEESASLIGVLANRGIKGSEAGTSLNSVLVNLMGVGGQAAEALDTLKVSMYDDETGARKSVTEVLTELNGKLAECTDEQKDLFTAQIGGKTQMDTLQALLAGMNEEYTDLNETISNSDGVLMSTAKTMQDNFNGAVTEAKSALEGLGISIYDTFSDDLTSGIRKVTEYISRISEFGVQKGNITSVLKSISSEVSVILKRLIEGLGDEVKNGTEVFNGVILGIVDIITNTLPSFTETILPVLIEGLFNLINGMIERLPDIIDVLLDLGLSLVMGIQEGMLQSVTILSEKLPEILEIAFEYLVNNIPFIITTGYQITLTLIDAIADNLPMLVEMALKLIMTIAHAIIDNLDKIIESTLKLVDAICQAILDNLDLIIDATIEIILALTQAIIDNLPEIVEAAIEILVTLGAALIEFVARLTDYIPEVIQKVKEAFTDYDWAGLGGEIMQSIFDGINNVGEKAQSLLASAGEHIIDALGFHADGTWSLPFFAEGGTLTNGSAIVGEAGPELLSVANGRAVVTPLADVPGAAFAGMGNQTVYITNSINVENVSSDYDVRRINEQLAIEQRNAYDAIGGW